MEDYYMKEDIAEDYIGEIGHNFEEHILEVAA
jgi:hypothetical protein